ncbi:MAG: CNP1-like family protein [Gammaproteobacteria bacterium]
MNHIQFLLFAGCLPLFFAGNAAAEFGEDDYGEADGFKFQEKAVIPESDVVIPRWPELDEGIEVNLGLDGFPFALLIDPASISVDRKHVVRYTAILKSVNASMNISYEAIDCADKTYRRYAYGAAGRFKQVRDSKWTRIVPQGAGRFRPVLMNSYLCPVPGKKPVDKLSKRLRSDRTSVLQDQQEE